MKLLAPHRGFECETAVSREWDAIGDTDILSVPSGSDPVCVARDVMERIGVRTAVLPLLGMCCFLVAGRCAISPELAAEADDLLIRNVMVVSPERQTAYGPVDVSVLEGRIVAIGDALPGDAFPDGHVIDGSNRYLCPGLIDSHVHLSMIPGMHRGHEQQFPDIARAARAQIPRSYLYHGFTSVIDLISDRVSMEEWNAQEIRPHGYFCGAAPIIDGYPTQRIPAEIRYQALPNFLFDPTRADSFPTGMDPAAHSPATVVERIAEMGAIGVKTFWEDGFGPARNLPVPPTPVLKELVSAARMRGIPVLLHANSEESQRIGLEVGVDGFVHGLWTWDGADVPGLPRRVTDLLDAIIERQVAWQPTVQVLYGERDLFDPGFLTRQDVRAVVPPDVLDWYASGEGQWLVKEMGKVPYVHEVLATGRWQEIDEQPVRHVMQALSYLARNGGRLLFGTDTPSAPTYANPAGLNGRREMNHWIEAGVSPRDLFRAATLANAEFFGLEKEIGTVEVGKRADLLLLAANPLESVTAFDEIERVILAGRPLSRETLSAEAAPSPHVR